MYSLFAFLFCFWQLAIFRQYTLFSFFLPFFAFFPFFLFRRVAGLFGGLFLGAGLGAVSCCLCVCVRRLVIRGQGLGRGVILATLGAVSGKAWPCLPVSPFRGSAVRGCGLVAGGRLRVHLGPARVCQGVSFSNKCSIRGVRTSVPNKCSGAFLGHFQNFSNRILTEFFVFFRASRTES